MVDDGSDDGEIRLLFVGYSRYRGLHQTITSRFSKQRLVNYEFWGNFHAINTFAPQVPQTTHVPRLRKCRDFAPTHRCYSQSISSLSFAADFACQTPYMIEEVTRYNPAPLTRTPMLHSEARPTYHFVQPPRILRTSHSLHALQHRVARCLMVTMASSIHFCSVLRLEFGDTGRDAARRPTNRSKDPG